MSWLWLLLGLVTAASAPPRHELHTKASPVVAPCVAVAAIAYERAIGGKVLVETALLFDPASTDGADVVVAADAELNRIIEGGATDPELDVDVAKIPWVLVSASGAETVSREALGRAGTTVWVMGGVVGREVSRSLTRLGIALDRVERLRDPVRSFRLGPGDTAVVPLSLAGTGPVSSIDIPPLVARALGVRASPHKAAARAFVEFLSTEQGGAAFRACGRTDAR
jgi:hypothetical protein